MHQGMTYRRLLLCLQTLDQEQLDCHITIEDSTDEFYPAILNFISTDDVLHAGHPYFCIQPFQTKE